MTNAIQFIANVLAQLILIRAYCKLLDMRSNVVFGILSITGMIVAIVVDDLLSVPLFRTAIMGPVVFFVLPIACSQGALGRRVLRCALILTAMIVSALLVYLIYTILFGTMALEDAGYATPTSALISLTLATTCTGFCIESLLALVARLEKREDITLIPPFVLLLLWSYIISVVCFTLAGDKDYVVGFDLGAVDFIYYALVLALCFASAALFRGDVKTAQHKSQRTLNGEQSKLVRAKIDAATTRAAITRRLHHVLVNKASTICELAEQGDTHDAEVYLNALRDQASHAVKASSDGLGTEA